MLKTLDKFMTLHPWHPRVFPFAAYVAMLAAVGMLRDWDSRSYVVTYPLMCVVTVAILWRYRALTPELNWRFHWVAVPVAAAATVGWVYPGMVMSDTWPSWFALDEKPMPEEMGPVFGWTAMAMRTAGMAMVVPMFEELFFRSAMLRSLYRPRALWVALVQWGEEVPGLGGWVMRTKMAQRYITEDRPMARAFASTPLGKLSVFSVVMSSVLWAPISHHMRDWPGTVVCGVLYALVVGWTNREALGQKKLGLGPVVWTHGLTNLFLCAWTVWSGDWRFL